MKAPIIGGIGYDDAITNGALFQTQVKVSQPILNRKIREGENERVGIPGKNLQNSLALSAMQLKHDISAEYIISCADLDIQKFNSETIKLLSSEQDILKQLVERGVLSQSSYMSFLLELQGLQRILKESEIQFKKDIAQLNGICGIMDTGVLNLSDPSIESSANNLISENPFLKQFYYDSLRIANSRTIMANHYLPTINWAANAGILASKYNNIDRNMGMSFGLNLGIPIFDWNQKKIQNEQFKIEEDTRLHYRNYFYFQREQQLSSLRNELKEIEESMQLYLKQKEIADELIKSGRQMLDAGTMQISDFLLMLRNYRELGFSINQARYRKQQLINDLNYYHW